MMKCIYFVVTATIFALLAVSPVSADLVELIANGDFENVTEGKFDSWFSGTDNWTAGDTLPVTVSTSPIISDTNSALCVHGTSGTNISSCLTQPLGSLVSDFTFSCDFAVLTGGGNSTRSFNLLLQAGGNANNDVSSTVNFKVVDAGDKTNATFQVYTGSAWKTLTDLVPVPTFDTGTLRKWDGETPSINHLEVTANWDEPTGATYDITLNGTTVSGLTYFQGSAPGINGKPNTLAQVNFAYASTYADYLVDNVSVSGQDYETKLAPVIPWNEGKPVINGPDVYGASPEKDFLYLVPTIGERPISFTAENLPIGLSIDTETGQIRGKAEKKGEYQVVVTAENKQGKCSKTLNLVIDDNAIALTPPMGWCSWNCYQRDIDATKIKATADGMVQSGLAARGYSYINIDSGWQSQERGGEFNSIIPHDGFPDMKVLCGDIHSLGLKAGLYSSPYVIPWGTDGCGTTSGLRDTNFEKFGDLAGKYIGIDKHEHEDVSQWADWGFDYLKYDWAVTDMILTERMSKELRASSRDIVFSATTNVSINDAAEVQELANVWRSNSDTKPQWQSVLANGFNNQQWNSAIGPGHWFDLDMTALKPRDGECLTKNEQIACISCWMMQPSPIMIDCDLTETLDDFTLRLLCNEEIIAVNQDSLGKPAESILKTDSWDIQLKPLADGSYALAVFNLSNASGKSPKVDLSRFGFDENFMVRDLWNKTDLGEFDNGFEVGVNSHCAKVFKVSMPSLTSQIPGDANRDGKVDGSDVTILAANWQVGVDGVETANWEMGDFNNDGKVDASDVTILAANWQANVTAATASVPEPSTVILLLTALASLLIVR